ncbi:hypothetical protein [Roseateles sp.]|uniref:hypothetical protein n=1 Tax=Roseateles sp. TaxID=1971397 RepID=UPI00286D48B6|nr:hypothetical protein [Roseateles sp.]
MTVGSEICRLLAICLFGMPAARHYRICSSRGDKLQSLRAVVGAKFFQQGHQLRAFFKMAGAQTQLSLAQKQVAEQAQRLNLTAETLQGLRLQQA